MIQDHSFDARHPCSADRRWRYRATFACGEVTHGIYTQNDFQEPWLASAPAWSRAGASANLASALELTRDSHLKDVLEDTYLKVDERRTYRPFSDLRQKWS